MKVLLDPRLLTFNDHIDFQDETGVPVLDALKQFVATGEADPRVHRALLWLYVRHQNPTLSLEQAGRIPVGSIEWALPEVEVPEPAEDEQ